MGEAAEWPDAVDGGRGAGGGGNRTPRRGHEPHARCGWYGAGLPQGRRGPLGVCLSVCVEGGGVSRVWCVWASLGRLWGWGAVGAGEGQGLPEGV